MALTLPSYMDILNVVLSVYRTLPPAIVAGTPVPPDTDPGSVFYALAVATATVVDGLYGVVEDSDSDLRLATAVGVDLEALGALTGTKRKPEVLATIALASTRYVASPTPVIVAAKRRVIIQTRGGTTVNAITQQDPTLPSGQAGVIAAGAMQGYLLATAVDGTGASGNVGAGSVVQPGDAFPGVDVFTIPLVATPPAPLVATVGAVGTTTYPYQAVARGRQGTTLPSATGQTTTGNAMLSSTNYTTITVPNAGDGTTGNALGYDILKNVGTSLNPTWQLLGSTVSPANTLNDTGQATTIYPYPTTYTANVGVGGVDPEPDDGAPGLRQRIPANVAAQAGATLAAMQAAINNVAGVAACFVTDGATAGTATVLWTASTVPAPAAVAAAVAAAALAAKPVGVQIGALSQIVPTAVQVTYTVTALPSVTNKSSLVTPIQNALIAFFNGQTPGYPVYWSAVSGAIYAVSGVQSIVSLTLQPAGGSVYSSDVPGAIGRLYSLGSISATVS